MLLGIQDILLSREAPGQNGPVSLQSRGSDEVVILQDSVGVVFGRRAAPPEGAFPKRVDLDHAALQDVYVRPLQGRYVAVPDPCAFGHLVLDMHQWRSHRVDCGVLFRSGQDLSAGQQEEASRFLQMPSLSSTIVICGGTSGLRMGLRFITDGKCGLPSHMLSRFRTA